MDRSVEDVYKDFKGRRSGMAKALTSDVDNFYRACDPAKENLCLYGFEDSSWRVDLPAEEVPPELPEPSLGINFARDGMARKDWLSLVAVHSDAWLTAVALYQGACFNKQQREQLFNLMNEHPTLFELVTGRVKEKNEKNNEKNSSAVHKRKKEPPAKKRVSQTRKGKVEEEDEDDGDGGDGDEVDEEEGDGDGDGDGDDGEANEDTYCGSCGAQYTNAQFWIACDVCEKWYHGSCVKMTSQKASSIGEYRCPACANKKARI